MKKSIIFLILLTFVAGNAFGAAAKLETKLVSTSLSNGVSGTYFANNAGTNDATAFQISTGHAQGNVVYATGNFVSDIYFKDIAGAKFASTDLLQTELAYSSTAFDTDWKTK